MQLPELIMYKNNFVITRSTFFFKNLEQIKNAIIGMSKFVSQGVNFYYIFSYIQHLNSKILHGEKLLQPHIATSYQMKTEKKGLHHKLILS